MIRLDTITSMAKPGETKYFATVKLVLVRILKYIFIKIKIMVLEVGYNNAIEDNPFYN